MERLGRLDDRLEVARPCQPIGRCVRGWRGSSGRHRRVMLTRVGQDRARDRSRRSCSSTDIETPRRSPCESTRSPGSPARRATSARSALTARLGLGWRRRNRRLVGLRRDVPGHDLPVAVLFGPQQRDRRVVRLARRRGSVAPKCCPYARGRFVGAPGVIRLAQSNRPPHRRARRRERTGRDAAGAPREARASVSGTPTSAPRASPLAEGVVRGFQIRPGSETARVPRSKADGSCASCARHA